MAHLFIVVVYDSFNRKNVKISTTYYFPDFSFFMSQDDAHYHNHQNAPMDLTNTSMYTHMFLNLFLTATILRILDLSVVEAKDV